MSVFALQFQREGSGFLVFLLRPRMSWPCSPPVGRGHLGMKLTAAHGAWKWKVPHPIQAQLGSPTRAPSPPSQHGLEGDVSPLTMQGTQSPRSPFHPESPPISQPPVNLPVSLSELHSRGWIKTKPPSLTSQLFHGLVFPPTPFRAAVGVMGVTYKLWCFSSLVLCICTCWCLTGTVSGMWPVSSLYRRHLVPALVELTIASSLNMPLWR